VSSAISSRHRETLLTQCSMAVILYSFPATWSYFFSRTQCQLAIAQLSSVSRSGDGPSS
jgi:hypothetical protein